MRAELETNRLAVAVKAVGVGALTLAAVPLAAQEPINQPLSDGYGVERKTGRALFALPQINSVGGDGPASMAVSFHHADGGSVVQSGVPSISHYEVNPQGVITHPQAAERYFATTINYGNISERFRRVWTGSAYSTVYEPEYPTGSTFDGSTFTNKHGLKIHFTYASGGFIYTVEHPDGRTMTFDLSGADAARSIKNNFGYAFKIDLVSSVINYGWAFDDFTMSYQAVNLAEDYCSLSTGGLCTGLSKTRVGTYAGIEDDQVTAANPNGVDYWERFLFTDPAGNQTAMRNELLAAVTVPPSCTAITIPGNTHGSTITYNACSAPQFGWRAYPAGLTPPGSTIETHKIDYNLDPGYISGLTHDDVRITEVEMDGVTVDYDVVFYRPGSSYGGQSYAPSWVNITAKIDGEEISYSSAYQLYPFWGQSRRVLMHTRDANGLTTSYPFNSEWEVNGVGYPEGNGYSHELDARQNIIRTTYTPKTGSSEADLVTSYTYPASCSAATQTTCNKPLTMTDPNGNVTNYEYNQYGQLTKETQPAPTAGAARPTTINEYTLRTAYIKGPGGSVVAAGPPISLLTKSYTCISAANCSASTPASDKVVTEYDYGPTTGLNNLNLRGISVTAQNDQGQIETLRTCYRYNYFGEKISRTQPKANLQSCPA
jgi:YD repeat-containing protein